MSDDDDDDNDDKGGREYNEWNQKLICFVFSRCLETLIGSQVKKIRSTLSDIRVLDKAADTTNKRLSMLNLHDEVRVLFPFICNTLSFPAKLMSRLRDFPL